MVSLAFKIFQMSPIFIDRKLTEYRLIFNGDCLHIFIFSSSMKYCLTVYRILTSMQSVMIICVVFGYTIL